MEWYTSILQVLQIKVALPNSRPAEIPDYQAIALRKRSGDVIRAAPAVDIAVDNEAIVLVPTVVEVTDDVEVKVVELVIVNVVADVVAVPAAVESVEISVLVVLVVSAVAIVLVVQSVVVETVVVHHSVGWCPKSSLSGVRCEPEQW